MNRQSTIIFATLIVAFIIFITVRGDLPSWLALFTQKGTKVTSTVGTAPAASSGGGILGTIGGLISGGLASLIPGGVGTAISAGGKAIAGIVGG